MLWVRRSTVERPSPLRVCSNLFYNKLNGSVPSSLSALTKLSELCVTPSLPTAFARAAEEGRDRSALLRACGMSGAHVGGIERGPCGSRAVAVLSEGTSGTRCDYGVLRHPILWVLVRGYRRGTWSLWVRRSIVPSGRVRFGCAATSATTR